MTRKEYEAKYGLAPVISDSTLDISSAPVRMTTAEYEAKYLKPTPKPGLIAKPGEKGGLVGGTFGEALSGLGTLYGGGEQGIATKLKQDIQAGASDIAKGDVIKGVAKAGLRTAGDVAGAVFAPVGAALQAVGFNKLTDYIGEKVGQPIGEKLAENPITYNIINTHPNVEEDFSRALNLLFAKGEKGSIEPKTIIPRTLEQIRPLTETIKNIPSKISESHNTKLVENVANEIKQVENRYAGTRKINEFTGDTGEASRLRIAQTDALVGSVDENGIIRTKQPGGAVEKYRQATIDGAESVVRDNLIREGKKVNIGEVAKALTLATYRSGLEGADLARAVKGLKTELEGLRLRADELGNIDLFKIHDAKISTTLNINYAKDSTPTIKFRKAKANAYKTIVEDKSNVSVEVNGKTYGIKEINKELGKYYEDIARLEALDGKSVGKGGKLGKYTAQISGNIIGSAVGGVFGGIPGMAVGAVVGGETAGYIKGRQARSTFGQGTGLETPKNPILEQAKIEAKLPSEVNLKIPDIKVGSPKDVPKTKEILKVEKDIAKNVEQQKAAIKAGDFNLVSALKEIYQVLVSYLKDLIQKARKEQGGFINLGEDISGSSKPGNKLKTPTKETTPSDNTTTNLKEFKGFKDLTTNILERLKGKSITSKQEILDLTNMPNLRQPERDLIRNVVQDFGDKVPVQEFANKVKTELLPLKRVGAQQKRIMPRYENITLPEELRGPVANYDEHVYESPIETSAGKVHFENQSGEGHNFDTNYFAHTRIEDLPEATPSSVVKKKFGKEVYDVPVHKTGTTRRVIELQSDLFQKGRLDVEYPNELKSAVEDLRNPSGEWRKRITEKDRQIQLKSLEGKYSQSVENKSKLEPYRNTWHERIIREEVKQAAKDGKTKLQFPTGETAMKIEGLGTADTWKLVEDSKKYPDAWREVATLTTDNMKVGQRVAVEDGGTDWIITDVLGDGKFKAIQKGELEHKMKLRKADGLDSSVEATAKEWSRLSETFDISGKVDTNNPIYKFYEKEVGRFLQNKFDAKVITDPQGVKWYEVNIPKEAKSLPVQAHGHISGKTALITGIAGVAAAVLGPIAAQKLSDYLKSLSEEDIKKQFPSFDAEKTFNTNAVSTTESLQKEQEQNIKDFYGNIKDYGPVLGK